MEVKIRHFEDNDCDYVAQKLFAGTPQSEAAAMIAEWKTLLYKGQYFEMFAVLADGELAGLVSLYERNKGVVTVGAILTPEYKYKGIAQKAITQLFCHATARGFAKADARVSKDNLPSLRLCEKLGFCVVGDDVTADGKEVFCLEKAL